MSRIGSSAADLAAPRAGRSRAPAPGTATGRQAFATAGTDEKRERIMAVAARLFFEHGYASTTIALIARELGVTKPFVYYYFRDKLELFEAISWRPTVECLTAMDFDPADTRPAHLKLAEGLEKLIRATVAHHPAATLPYREPQVYGAGYRKAAKRLADGFYAKTASLLEQARRDGRADFDDAKVTALAVAGIPGFLYAWYRPAGRFGQDEIVAQLTRIAVRAIGLRPGLRPDNGRR